MKILNSKLIQEVRLTGSQHQWLRVSQVIIFTFMATFFAVVSIYHITQFYPDEGLNSGQIPSAPASFNETLLTHRLVKFDLDAGLSNKNEAGLAWGNVDRFLINVRKNCNQDMSTLHFLRCANHILGQNFLYQDAWTVTSGYAHHYSDCDANVYLLIDATRAAGKEINIVYSPGHAFISFIGDSGK